MQLHTLRPNKIHRGRKRIGRGGRRGTYSGRGQKGQKAHGGRKRPHPLIEDFKKIPKRRGLKHLPKSSKPTIIKFSLLERLALKGEITPQVLASEGIIPSAKTLIKILDSGAIPKAVAVRGIPCSKSAREKIEKSGGKIS